MAGYKETPRQKMIAMMYLVLTALLALNVSKEVLDAFKVVNDSVELTNENFSAKLSGLHQIFDSRYALDSEKVGPFRDKANEARQLSDDLRSYVEDMKWRLVSAVERIEYDSAKIIPLGRLKKLDDFTTTTNFFMRGTVDGSKGEGIELKEKIDKYRVNMLNLVDPGYRNQIKIGLQTDGNYTDRDGKALNWIQYNFYNTVMAANLTILNKIITEVHNAEFDVVNYLLSSIDAADFKHDAVFARVLPKKDYVLLGDKYEAEIVVAAYSTTQNPDVYIMEGVDRLTSDQISRARKYAGSAGIVRYSVPAQTEGQKRYAGIVRLTNPLGEIEDFPFSSQYLVAEPTATVSASKMNVFYAGVENPISISAPGIPLENLVVELSTGQVKPDNRPGHYIVNVSADKREVIVSVSARIDGQLKKQGDKTYRIKRVPDPIAQIAGMREGTINRNVLAEAAAIEASMPQDFEFDLNFKVISFTMTSVSGSIVWDRKTNTNRLTEEMKNRIKTSNRGDRIWFEGIVARGPDGIDRPLSPITLTLN